MKRLMPAKSTLIGDHLLGASLALITADYQHLLFAGCRFASTRSKLAQTWGNTSCGLYIKLAA